MSRIHILQQIHKKDGYLMSYSPPFPPTVSSSPYSSGFHKEPNPSSGSKISPAVLFIIVILAVLFFISGLLHLLVRFLIKHPSSSASSQDNNRYPELSTSDALQRQLQQLFHLHDSGLDQAFIDALPVFQYREIVGLKEPFDCAVCLCEFSEKDKLRLLPVCSHAFHINCIDTWLLSNSTCPLCRGTLFAPGYSIENPMFDFDDFREEDVRLGNGGGFVGSAQKTVEIEETIVKKGVLPVRLGKFRRVNGDGGESVIGETSSSSLDARRCYSMGSYEYVLGDSVLRVALPKDQHGREVRPSKGQENGGSNTNTADEVGDLEGNNINKVSRGESYSVSKIWLWGKKGKFSTSTDVHSGMPSSLNMDLPWMGQAQGV